MNESPQSVGVSPSFGNRTATDRMPEVHDQLGVLEGQLEIAESVASSLVDRLGPVLRSSLESADDKMVSVPEEPTRTPVGDRVRGIRVRLAAVVGRLEDAASRLEV